MNDNQQTRTDAKNWTKDAESTVSNLFGKAQDLVRDSSNHHIVIRRPNAKLIDVPVKLPVLIVAAVFVILFLFAPRTLVIGMAAALYFQVRISLERNVESPQRDVDDVEYRRVD